MSQASSPIAVPLLKAEDVIPHLGKPTHWKQGRSAKALADSWFNAAGLPKSMQVLLHSAPELRGAELIDGWLERKTDLGDGCGAPSQTDLLALLGLENELAVLAVEGKVDETFGLLVDEWLADGSLRKHKRLQRICERLDLEPSGIGHLRYQLLHRFAAALIEAERFRASKVVVAVQSFCANATGRTDFVAFCTALGLADQGISYLAGPKHFGGRDLWTGWMSDNIWDGYFDRPGSPDFPTLEEIRSDEPRGS
jgi:hypothetical protein